MCVHTEHGERSEPSPGSWRENLLLQRTVYICVANEFTVCLPAKIQWANGNWKRSPVKKRMAVYSKTKERELVIHSTELAG